MAHICMVKHIICTAVHTFAYNTSRRHCRARFYLLHYFVAAAAAAGFVVVGASEIRARMLVPEMRTIRIVNVTCVRSHSSRTIMRVRAIVRRIRAD